MVRQQTVNLWRKRGGSSPSTSTNLRILIGEGRHEDDQG